MVPKELTGRSDASPGDSGAAAGPAGAHSWRERSLRIWRDERPAVAIPRDLGIVVLFLALLLTGLWSYTGQPFPETSPLVVIESGSMMHPDAPYGRVGTIDAGDLVLVKRADDPNDVETAYGPGEREGYGARGDVLVYRPRGDPNQTPIIHRALTFVEVTATVDAEGNTTRSYSYWNERGAFIQEASSVNMPAAGIHGMKPPASGYVTKGDNPNTNQYADQVSHVPGLLVEPEWVIGKSRGEIPWLGLVKLALTGNPVPSRADEVPQCLVLKAWAPCDEWVMLGLSLGGVILAPIVLEAVARRHPPFRRWVRGNNT